MKVIFKNPISQKFELGIVVKSYSVNKIKKYDIISEKGVYHPALSTNIRKKGYINEKYTKNIASKIETNLSKETQGNYKSTDYLPNILKIEI
jgi:hypothetical protein